MLRPLLGAGDSSHHHPKIYLLGTLPSFCLSPGQACPCQAICFLPTFDVSLPYTLTKLIFLKHHFARHHSP